MKTFNLLTYLSKVSQARQPSAIRKLMPLVAQPGMISLGGGLPNASLFPFEQIHFTLKDGTHLQIDNKDVDQALQYSPTPGLSCLVEQLQQLQKREHQCSTIRCSVTGGSQDALTKAFEAVLNPGDSLLVEDPCYSGALAHLNPFGARLVPVPLDHQGLIPAKLEQLLKESQHDRDRPRVLYTIPTAQNPSGATLSNARRQQVFELCQKYDILILEDDPYYFLHPNRLNLTSFLQLDQEQERVVRFDSLSKLVSSGIRIGFVSGPAQLVERIDLHTQATNLHTSGVSQILVSKLLEHWGEQGFNAHVDHVTQFYTNQRDFLQEAALQHLQGLAEWHIPEAGMFLWFKLLGISNTTKLIEEKASQANVLFVPGQSFSPTNSPSEYVRASYSTATKEQMQIAMERLAMLIKQEHQV